MSVTILRMGHRYERDKRITTHLGLVARAFGADGIIIGDIADREVERTIKEVIEKFGGEFAIEMGKNSLKVLKDWKDAGGEVVHLTFYGLPLPSIIDEIRASPHKKLVVVGASKVPREVYNLATYNVSITTQPHSEIAALAIFLDYLYQGAEFTKNFKDAQIEIVPSKDGKIVRQVEHKEGPLS